MTEIWSLAVGEDRELVNELRAKAIEQETASRREAGQGAQIVPIEKDESNWNLDAFLYGAVSLTSLAFRIWKLICSARTLAVDAVLQPFVRVLERRRTLCVY